MKKYSRLWAIVALSILMIIALVRLGNIEISWATLNRVHWGWYSLVAVSYYASVIGRGWRWQAILITMGRPVSFIYAATLLIAGMFLSSILPARAGDVGRVVMLKQDHNIPISQGIASLAGERALDVFAILTMAIVGAYFALPGYMPPEVLQLMVGIGALFLIGLIGLLLMPGLEKWLRQASFLRKMLSARLWTFYQKLLDFGFSLIQGVRLLGQKPRNLGFIIIQSYLIWLCDALMIYFILISLNVVQPFSVSLFVAMITDLVTAVPLTPGSLGQFDAALVSLLAFFGLAATDGSLTALLLRLVQLWTFIAVSGFITYVFGFSRALDFGSGRPDLISDKTETASSLAES